MLVYRPPAKARPVVLGSVGGRLGPPLPGRVCHKVTALPPHEAVLDEVDPVDVRLVVDVLQALQDGLAFYAVLIVCDKEVQKIGYAFSKHSE